MWSSPEAHHDVFVDQAVDASAGFEISPQSEDGAFQPTINVAPGAITDADGKPIVGEVAIYAEALTSSQTNAGK